MDTYFKFKMFTEYIIPIALFVIVVAIVIFYTTISVIKESRIEKFFLKNGYKRKRYGAFYGWVRESDNKRVDDIDIRGWSLKQIKEKYK